jgi:UDP-N-acetylmuramoyl-tripeptide--D-alanyl-D-alanine ligase
MTDPLFSLALLTGFAVFAAKRCLTYMHALQQEEYDNARFIQWMIDGRVFDKRLSLALLASGVLAFFLPAFIFMLLVFMGFIATAYVEKDPRKESKKKLAMTMRAKRIYFTGLALSIALAASWVFVQNHPWLWIISVQAVPFFLCLANLLLDPYEQQIQQKFWDEAHEKLMRVQPTVIGITGSFGKTSVKHILGHILKTQAKTLITPGSVNTPMGIARIIREELDESHKYFVVEMGAYGPGSIARLCRLAPPDFGVITAIGHAHYERFKSLEAVAQAKFELAEAVIAKGPGKIAIHERTLRFEHTRDMKNMHPDRFVIGGEAPAFDPNKRPDVSYLQDDDVKIQRVLQLPTGLEVRITWKDQTYRLDVPLYGLHHAHNVTLAFAIAMTMGIAAEDIATALKTVPQIQHRLEVRKQGEITIIDDAFNSNPLGFQSALDLLGIIEKTGRKILITPGMVELGAAHDEAHRQIGYSAGRVCDIAIVVQPGRIPSFIKGFQDSGAGKTLLEVSTFQEASKWIDQNKQAGDIVLIENDLPDIYERIPQI